MEQCSGRVPRSARLFSHNSVFFSVCRACVVYSIPALFTAVPVGAEGRAYLLVLRAIMTTALCDIIVSNECEIPVRRVVHATGSQQQAAGGPAVLVVEVCRLQILVDIVPGTLEVPRVTLRTPVCNRRISLSLSIQLVRVYPSRWTVKESLLVAHAPHPDTCSYVYMSPSLQPKHLYQYGILIRLLLLAHQISSQDPLNHAPTCCSSHFPAHSLNEYEFVSHV